MSADLNVITHWLLELVEGNWWAVLSYIHLSRVTLMDNELTMAARSP